MTFKSTETMSASTDHGGRLGRVEGQISAFDSRLSNLEITQQNHGTLLYEIRTAVTTQTAKSGSVISEWTRTGAGIVQTLAIIAALLVYVAKSTAVGEFTAPMVRMQTWMEQTEKRLDRERVSTFSKGDAAPH